MNDLVKIEFTSTSNDKIVSECLSRLGIGVPKKEELLQTCHLVRIQNEEFVVHFKELFLLRGDTVTWYEGDLERRNQIITLLESWGLIKVVSANISNAYGREISDEPVKIFKIKRNDKKRWKIRKMIDTEKMIEAGILDGR